LDGGAGTDSLTFTLAGNADALDHVSKVESITLAGASGSLTLAAGNTTTSGNLSINAGALTGSLNLDASSLAEGLTYIAGSHGDTVVGSAHDDSLTGGAGADTFTMAGNLTAADTLDGGAGADSLTFTLAGNADALDHVSKVESITLAGASGSLNLVAGNTTTSGNLSINAGALTGSLNLDASALAEGLTYIAGSHGDTVVGSTHDDSLTGGAGADTFTMAGNLTAADTLDGGGGIDSLGFTLTGSTDVLAHVCLIETITLTDSGSDESLTLYAANTTSSGNLSIDASGLGHCLTLDGCALTEGLTYIGGDLGDTVTGSIYADSLTGGTGDDSMSGGAGADTIHGGGGADTLEGGDGDNTLYDDATAMHLSAGSGDDTFMVSFDLAETHSAAIDGGGGTNTLDFSLVTDATYHAEVDLSTGNGYITDAASATQNSYSLSNINNLVGSSGDDYLFGNTSANSIHGGAGNDFIFGQGGGDTMTGGDGADTFFFSVAGDCGTTNIIMDFTSGTDKIGVDTSDTGLFHGIAVDGNSYSVETTTSFAGYTATTTGATFIFDSTSHILYYDADGSGGGSAVEIATLTGVSSLASADISLVSEAHHIGP
jgi:Ca2+-binding RTX toxin-like protein